MSRLEELHAEADRLVSLRQDAERAWARTGNGPSGPEWEAVVSARRAADYAVQAELAEIRLRGFAGGQYLEALRAEGTGP